MIKKECFTAEWIEQVSSELHYNDKNLIEKVIRALSLLEVLVKAGCPLVFKGGTALMLLGNLLIVCHCYRASDTVIRIISARRATKTESKFYRK